MNNNEIFKKLRVALQLRDDQIVEILELVNFRISKGEIGNIFRQEDHPKFMECGDQILRNFLNGLVIHLRGTKENPKNAKEVISANAKEVTKKVAEDKTSKPISKDKPKGEFKPKSSFKPKTGAQKTAPKVQVVEKINFKNGKKKKD
ncbi:DUF1456 family protein [Flavobacterium amnicola]|uniref:DUF1456 family protein n=1 Tax=Flavobacterium amnicola TaxID=2506422 RepID=A0A4Q1K3Y0_9FLAO|nr:DUF1456 family protein [Flavobacterium amnicola]RXR19447.1 DUF1456 family protein [Flavobacterium amnicola]